MLIQLGTRSDEVDVTDLLNACHERIRAFMAMAIRLGQAIDPAAAEVREVARVVGRYFAYALPLHVADEDEDIRPMLAGREAAIDAALAEMAQEHVEHEQDVAHLVELCATLEREPARHAELRVELGLVTARLMHDFTSHLDREERVVFPAIRRMPAEVRARLRDRIRARRANAS